MSIERLGNVQTQGAQMSTEAQRETGLSRAMSELRRAVEANSMVASELQRRLSVVLIPEAPIHPDAPEQAVELDQCELAGGLNNAADLIKNTNEILHNVLARLDL